MGYEHVSIHTRKEWAKIFKDCGFKIKSIKGTGGLFFGSLDFDRRRIIFALSVILDVILEKLPFSYLWSELLIFELEI